jgi:murein DD-endopeptidase MepM/ murein hydrolase activator NlpD
MNNRKGLMILHLNNRSKLTLSCLIIIITAAVVIRYLYNSNLNSYDIYINGKSIGYVKNQIELYNAEDSIKADEEKRFGKIKFKDDIKLIKKHINNDKYLQNSKDIKKSILENSNTKVSAVLMKSDGKKVAILANETEMRRVLDEMKSLYKEREKSDELKLTNHITYINENMKIGEVNTVEGVISTMSVNSKNPTIVFSKNDDEEKSLSNKNNLSRSRSIAEVSFMSTPSKGTITSPFGERWGAMHEGIDIGAPMGAPIYAAMDGQISCTEWEEGYGNVIKIDHGKEIQTVYAHCSSICSKVGEYVKRGEKIGLVGSTGRSTGPHVHFEVRVNGKAENPLNYLK